MSIVLENRLAHFKDTESAFSTMLLARTPVPCEFKGLVDIPLDEKPSIDGDVIQVQPKLVEKESFKPKPSAPEEAPAQQPGSGLQQLTAVEKLYITKKVAVRQVLKEQRERYLIRTTEQKHMYSVVEENSWWLGFICHGLRPLRLRILNDSGDEVIRIVRPFAFTTRVTPCQLQRMEVYSPPETLIGTIEQQWSPLKPIYSIKCRDGEDIFLLRGPANTLGIYRDLHFDIVRPDGVSVGSTCKRWRGVAHALFRSPILDKFVVSFRKDLKVEEKALLLAGTLLVDYMYYDT